MNEIAGLTLLLLHFLSDLILRLISQRRFKITVTSMFYLNVISGEPSDIAKKRCKPKCLILARHNLLFNNISDPNLN